MKLNGIKKILLKMSIENLKDLISNYEKFYLENNFNKNPQAWNKNTSYIKKTFDNLNFRGENAYVWQERSGDNKETYINYYKKIKGIDSESFFYKTFEDGSYGCISYDVDSIKISRDLLDSITEIYFLKYFFNNIENLNILDIGGGYGRLKKRFTDCFPKSKYYITDGIAESTYFSNIYLKNDKIIKLYEIEDKIKNLDINLVINIHSFPECCEEDVEWWVKLIKNNNVRYLFYVPNNSNINNTDTREFKIFNKYNYKIKYSRNMYTELNIKYSYGSPFYILENTDFKQV